MRYLDTAKALISAIRLRQWLKNLLIFVPAVTAHRITVPEVALQVCLAFLSFSLCASAGYVVNDLLDRKTDSEHPVKRKRPFASGALSIRTGFLTVAVLSLSAFFVGNLVSGRHVLFLLCYLILSITYSLFLKTMLLVDVFLLAFFYTFRIWLGGEAARVPISFWLAAFSTFFFFSLAVMKRFIELRMVADGSRETSRRNYRKDDAAMLGTWGTASGCASVVVLALYINADDISRLYHHPAYLWPVCPAVLFWITRVWMLANRNEVTYDPVLFAVTDSSSYVVGLVMAISVYLAL